MCWVALDRGLRLAEKRSLPAPNRDRWLKTRDTLYEEIQTKGWNKEGQFFSQVRHCFFLPCFPFSQLSAFNADEACYRAYV